MLKWKMYYYLLFLLFILAIGVYGCGGGGGGGAAPTPTTPTPTTSSVKVSGSATGLSSLVAGQGIKKQQVETTPLSNAIVEILAYDKSNKQTDSVTTTTLSTGTFTTNVTLSNSGGYIVVNVRRTGFAGYSKRIDFEKPADVNIPAILDAVVTAIAKRSDAVFSASTGEKVIKFGIFKTATGQKVVKVGREVDIRKQQGQNFTLTLQIEIPTNSIPPGTDTLVANLNTYNPVYDSERFPGQFLDSDGNKLVSTGFDFIDIADDKGTNLGALTTAAIRQGRLSKAQEKPTTITRQIPPGVCKNLLRDVACAETDTKGRCKGGKVKEKNDPSDGYQVPVYTYNPYKGEWVLLGIGTLDVNGNGVFDSGDPSAVGDINEDGEVDHKDYQKYCKDKEYNNEYLYLIIEITNEDFLESWWNLDYPLIFEEPKEICIDKTFVDQNGNPIAGVYVSLYDDDYDPQSFSYVSGSTGSDGKVKLKTVKTVLDSEDNVDRDATLYYWDPINYNSFSETVKLGDSPNCITKTNKILKEATCQVEGYVKDDTNAPLKNQFLYIYSSDPYYYNWDYTDNNGYFRMDARCNTVQDAYVGWDWEPKKRFNPNGNTTDYPTSEQSDDGVIVRLTDVVFKNQAPYAYGWLSSSSIFEGDTITAYIYAWDNECDSPLNYEIGGAPTSISGSSNECWLYKELDIPFSTAGTYPLTLSVTDSKGKTGTADIGTVYVSQAAQNRPPVITNAYPSKYSTSKRETITLYGSAYDPDGDTPLTYGWTDDCGGAFDNASSQSPKWTAPNTAGTCKITLTVSDPDNATDSKTVTIRSVNTPPVITAFNVPDTAKVGDTIQFSAVATDADGDALTYSWYIDTTQIGTGSSVTWRAIKQGTFRVEVRVSDGVTTVTQSKDIAVSGETSLDIRINSLFNLFKGGE